MFDRERLIKYIVIFGLILVIVCFNKIYFNAKSANKMSTVSLSISSKSDIFDKIEVYLITKTGNVKPFLQDKENKIYYIDYGAYINNIKISVDSDKKNEINALQFKISNKNYEFNNKDLEKRWKEDNNKIITILGIDDFKGLKRSIIPMFSTIINWPGFYSYFSINYLILIFIILVSIGLIAFFIEILLIKYFPFLFNNQKINLIIFFLILTIIFNIAYFQRPIYRSNQHTKFIHGLADSGYGNLNNDWFANTIDPLPVFSFFVSITYKYLNEKIFYLYQAILFGIFICSILLISFNLFNIKDKKAKILILSTFIILFHSQLFHSFFKTYFNFSMMYLLYEKGVAEQYLLGSSLQPCVFGVFILLSIYYFLKNRPYIAVIFSAIACIVHQGYLFFAGLLTLSYLIIILKDEKNFKKALLVGFLSLVLVLPVILYNRILFSPTSPDMIYKAYDLIVNKRIAHHTDPKIWINNTTFIKVLIITLALFIVRKKKIFIIILIPFTAGIVLTIIKLLTNSISIGMLTPWRVSVFLVPLSTTIVLAYIVEFVFNKFEKIIYKKEFLLKMICYVILLLPILNGLKYYIGKRDIFIDRSKGLTPYEKFVDKNKSPNDTYLIPNDYKEFRINTGAPVFVTKKSHPYKDVEVLEWGNRVSIIEDFYTKDNLMKKCEILQSLKLNYGITHVILEKNQFKWKLSCLEELYKDSKNGVYKIKE